MKKIFILALLTLSVASCRTYEKINYIQDVKPGQSEQIGNLNTIRIQPRDMLSIVVSSRNPELATMFNLPVYSYQAGSEISENGTSMRLLGYTVSDEGTIDFPILGTLKLEGLSRQETADLVKEKIIASQMLKDPIVTVQFINFKVAVTGEVTNPGTYAFSGDRMTVLDAERNIHQLDLRSVDLFKSPAYYLQQNDIVYVEPNHVRAGQSTINENNIKSVSLWVTIGSFLATITTLIVNLTLRR